MRKPDGWTALYDAVGVYSNGAAEQDGEKILVHLHRRRRHAQLAHLQGHARPARASDVTVYVIGYLEHQSQSARNEQRMQLQRMAELTGGHAFFPSSVKELDKIYEQIQRTIAARYSLGYMSSDTRTDGAWRRVDRCG